MIIICSLCKGNTPLTTSFETALRNNQGELTERKLLIIIFTDGCPTAHNLSQNEAIKQFQSALRNRQPIERIYCTIVACTDDDNALKYLNNWDATIPNLDIVDDFESEKKEIYKAGRLKAAFTFGDYIAKILLGSFVKEIDALDEKSSCCIV
jgi:hypothetical protein